MDLEMRRRLFAEEIAAVANLSTPGLVEALATVPRESYLGPGPWLVQGDLSGPRWTPDADPRHLYHNYSVAIDPDRKLFNGSPAFLSSVIDALHINRGNAVLHLGAGLGYYTAMLAQLVGATGRVIMVLVTRESDGNFSAQTMSMTAIYSAIGLRDDSLNAELGKAMMRGPRPAFTRLRRDAHERTTSCWLHGTGFCFTA